MKLVISYLNFVFLIEVKAKSKYRMLNFVFQFIKNTKWHFAYTVRAPKPPFIISKSEDQKSIIFSIFSKPI